MNNFYVYQHIRDEDGKIFYVGKGRGKRAWCKINRNSKWKNFVNKYKNWSVLIVHDGLEEGEAHSQEVKLIKSIGRENLCNLSDGGEGPAGYVFTDEQRQRLSQSHIGVSCGEKHHFYGKKRDEETRKKISESLKGNKNRGTSPMSIESRAKVSASRKGKLLGAAHHKYDNTQRIFVHDKHGTFAGTSHELRTKFSLPQANTSAMALGKRKSVHGWRLA